eukprot:13052007-Alexandrium_andersonii.AAC.1
MSASLVGSEMCIRDSPGGARSQEAKEAPSQRWAVTVRRPIRGAARPPRSCLLYTSDAADDM